MPKLTTLNTGTCKDHMFLDTKPNKNLPKVSLPTNAQHPTGTSCTGRPGNEIQSRDGEGINARPLLLVGRLHTSPPHSIYSARIRKQAETHHPGERDSGKRPRSGVTTESVCSLPLTGRQHIPPIAKTSLEDATNSTTLNTSPNPPTYSQHPATHGDPHRMHILL